MGLVESIEKIRQADLSSLEIIHYGDPRLKEICTPLEEVDDSVGALVERMFELMFASRGVGLAGPQVGVTVRLFIASPTFQQDDRHVCINPEIVWEEGCLSFPGISCKIKRRNIVTVRALGLKGEQFKQTREELAARIFQHEIDHLDGKLLVDRMGSIAKLTHRRALKELQQRYARTAY